MKKLQKLLNILTYKRPAGSKSEMDMIKRYIDVLPFVYTDGYGNRILRVGEGSTTMFSCHTDTVHKTAGRQKPMYDKTREEVFINGKECLGADDGAGIIIMIHMINAGVNGLYVFHREEEIGGRGSNYIQKETPELLDGIERCIAFDRRGTESIITHQGMERCCSDKFCEDFAQQLMKDVHSDIVFFPDNGGSFTDSANYTHIIPECTNLSCGYNAEHTSSETQDVSFLKKLIESLVKVDFENLATDRNPHIIEYADYGYSIYNKYTPNYKKPTEKIPTSIHGLSSGDILDFVYDYPEEAAQMLEEYRDETWYNRLIS